MINNINNATEKKMHHNVESFKIELSKVRTGRAHPNLIEDVIVEYYGQPTPLKQVASIVVEDSRTLAITPWEKSMIQAIDKAILNANLGLNPSSNADGIKVPLPALTEDRRKDLVKQVKSISESGKVAIRSARRDANQQLKDLIKKKEISEDDERRAQEKIQKMTDKFIGMIDKAALEKESDLMKV